MSMRTRAAAKVNIEFVLCLSFILAFTRPGLSLQSSTSVSRLFVFHTIETESFVGPSVELDNILRDGRGLLALYSHYLTKGDLDRALDAAASFVLYFRSQAALLNGRSGQTGAGNIRIENDGSLYFAGRLTPELMLQAATGKRNAKTYWEGMVAIAQSRDAKRSRGTPAMNEDQRLNILSCMKVVPEVAHCIEY